MSIKRISENEYVIIFVLKEENMDVGAISTSMIGQLYQVPNANNSEQPVQQPQQVQPVQQQGPAEERSESSTMQSQENSTGGEARESSSINVYA